MDYNMTNTQTYYATVFIMIVKILIVEVFSMMLREFVSNLTVIDYTMTNTHTYNATVLIMVVKYFIVEVIGMTLREFVSKLKLFR